MKAKIKTLETGAKAQLRAKGYVPAVEAAARLGFTAQSLYFWMDDGLIHGVKLGGRRWVEWNSVIQYFRTKDPEAAKLVGL